MFDREARTVSVRAFEKEGGMRFPTAGAVLFALLLAALPVPAFAQGGGASSTGTIQGRVTDAQGAVLPGVTVTATSPSALGAQTAVTSETGNYRFPALPPGVYTVVYELAGFNTVRREGIQLALGFTATLNIELALATLQETVTVTGESPVIDTTATRVQQNFKTEQLMSIPNGRDMWSLLAVTPAVQMTRIDVGGNRAGTQTGYSAYGLTGQVRVLIEGINTTEGTGGAGFYFDYSSLEEVFLGTTAQTAEMPNPGVQSQFIARSGGNQFSGEAYLDWYNGSLQGSNIPQDVIDRGIREHSNEIDKYYDWALNVGGPILQDKLWWFGTYRTQKNAVAQPAFAFDSTFDTKLWNAVGKLTYQVNQNNKLIGYYQWGQKSQPLRLLGCTGCAAYTYTDPGQTTLQDSGSWVYKGEWNSTISDKVYLEVRAGDFGYYFPLLANGSENFLWRDTGAAVVEGAERRWQLDRDRKQLNVASTYFLDTASAGTHTFKAGLEVLREKGWEGFEQRWGGNVETIYANGVSSSVSFGFPSASGEVGSLSAHDDLQSIAAIDVIGLFVNDTWNWGKLTMNLGARYDSYKGWLPEQAQLGGTNGPYTLAAQSFAEVDQYTWNSFAPRVGFIYDFSGEGRSVLKANYGLFWHNPGVTLGSSANPNIPEKFVTYNWNDANRNRRYDAGETVGNPTAQQVSGTISLNPDIKQPFTHEAGVFFEQQLTDTIGTRVGFVYKTEDDLTGNTFPGRNALNGAYSVPFNFVDRWPRQRGRQQRRPEHHALRDSFRPDRQLPREPGRRQRARPAVALQDRRSPDDQAVQQSLVGGDGRRVHLEQRLPGDRGQQLPAQSESARARGPDVLELQGHRQLRRVLGHPHFSSPAAPVGRELRAHPGRARHRRQRVRAGVPGLDDLRRGRRRAPRTEHLGVRHPAGSHLQPHRADPRPRLPRLLQHHQQQRPRDHHAVDGRQLPASGGDPRAVHRPPRRQAALVTDRPAAAPPRGGPRWP